MEARASTVIDQPTSRVFAFVTDIARMPEWVTGVTGARMVSATMGPGSRFVLDYQPGYRVTELTVVVEEHEPPRRFGFSTERGPFAFSERLELDPVDEGTRISSVIEADPDSLSTRVVTVLLGGWLHRTMVRRLDRELAALAHSIASDPTVRT